MEPRHPDLPRRNALIAALARQGLPAEALAVLTSLSVKQIGRIVPRQGDPPAAEPGPTPEEVMSRGRRRAGLSGAELRAMRREYRGHPEAIEWLGRVKADRRHNGRPFLDRDPDGDDLFAAEAPPRDVAPGGPPAFREAFVFGYRCGQSDSDVQTGPDRGRSGRRPRVSEDVSL